MAEMEPLALHQHGGGGGGVPIRLRADPLWLQQRALEEQVELWWFGEPAVSLLCYCSSVVLVLALGLGGVWLLSSASSVAGPSALWRLGVGSALCLLALVVLLKQLLSSAVQDMGCVQSRRRVELLRSGGRADPYLLLSAGLALAVCGTALLGVGRPDMPGPGTVLLSSGGVVVLSVALYGLGVYIQGWRSRRRRRRRRRRVRVYTVTGQRIQPWRDSASSQASLI